MQHPYIVNANANERFNQMVQDAEAQRLRKRFIPRKSGQNFLNKLRERFPVFKDQRLDESASSPA
jgi:hypothetical protein